MNMALERFVRELRDDSKSPATRTDRFKGHFEKFVTSLKKYETALIKAATLSQLKVQPGHTPLDIAELIKRQDFNINTVQQLLLDEKINTTQFLLLNQYVKIKSFSEEAELTLGKSLFTFYELLSKALLLIHDISQTDKAFIKISIVDPEAIQAYMIFNQYAQTSVTEVLYHATIAEAKAEPEIAKKLQSLTEETIRLKPEADQHKKFDAQALAQEAIKQAYEKATKEHGMTETDGKITLPQLLARKIKETATSTGIVTPEQIAEVVIQHLVPRKLIIAFDKQTEEQLKIEVLRLIFAEEKTGIIITADFFKAFLEQCFPSTDSKNKAIAIAIVSKKLEELQAFIDKQREKHKQIVDNRSVLATDITSTSDNIAHVVAKIAEHKKDANIDELGFVRRTLEQELELVTQKGEHSPKVAAALTAITTSYSIFKELDKEEELEKKLTEAVKLFGNLAKIFLVPDDVDSDSKTKKTAAIEEIINLFNENLSAILNTEEPQQQKEKIAIISTRLVAIAAELSDNPQLKDCIATLNALLSELSTAKTSSDKSKLIGKFAGKFIDDSVSAASSTAFTAITDLFKRKPKEKKDAVPATSTETKIETQDTSDQLEFYYQVLIQQQKILFEQLQLANMRALAVLAHSVDPKTIIIPGDNSGFVGMVWNFLQQLLPYRQLTGSYTSSPLPYQLEDQLQLLITIDTAIAEIAAIIIEAKPSDMESITPAIKRSHEELVQKLTKLRANKEELKDFLINMHLLIIQKQIQAIFDSKVNKGLLIDPKDTTYSNPKLSDREIAKRTSDYAKFAQLLAKKSLNDDFLQLLKELHLTSNHDIAAEAEKIQKILDALSGDKAKISNALSKTPEQKALRFEKISLSITFLSWLIKAGWKTFHFGLELYKEIIKLILIIIRPIKFILNYLHRYIAQRRRRAHHAFLITQLDGHIADFTTNHHNLAQDARAEVIFELNDILSMVGGFGKANQLTSLNERLAKLLTWAAAIEAATTPAADTTPAAVPPPQATPPSPTSPTSDSDKPAFDAAKELKDATETCAGKTGEKFKTELRERLNAFLCDRTSKIGKNLADLEEKIETYRAEVNASADLTLDLKAEKLAKFAKIQAKITVLKSKNELKLDFNANPHCLQSLKIAMAQIKKMDAQLEKIKAQTQITITPPTVAETAKAVALQTPLPVQCAAVAATVGYVIGDQISKTAQPWVDAVRSVVGYARSTPPTQTTELIDSDEDSAPAPWYSLARWIPTV